MFPVLFLAALYFPLASGSQCTHENVQQNTLQARQNYLDHPFEHARRLEEAAFAPMRIKLVYDDARMATLSNTQKDFLQTKLLPEAVDTWQAALSVVPVEGNLYAQRQCLEWYNTPGQTCKTVAENQMCFEAPIPDEHFGQQRVCSTCTNANDCQGDPCTVTEGTGVANADFVLYVHADMTPLCVGSVLAYAASCQRDQHDRPTFGMVNFCADRVDADPSQYSKQLNTALHEMSHALGFSADLFAYMRDETGEPRTPRDMNGDVIRTNHVCPNGKEVTNYAMPSSNTVQFFEERGHSVAKVVTPNVLNYVRNHFGCDDLNGAELESQEDACIGSHWEERIFEPEFMTAVQSVHNVLSGLTLAFFDDSGWYQANFSIAEPNYFGAKRGCQFAYAKCIENDQYGTPTPVDADHFCTNEEQIGCTIDGYSKAACSFQDHVGYIIPEWYRYFGDSQTAGGAKYTDYCPIYSGYVSGLCSDPANMFHPPGTTLNVQGETFSATSRCTRMTLHSKAASQWQLLNAGVGCYDVTCNDGLVRITVPTENAPLTVTCDQKGEQMAVEGYDGYLYCPDPFVMCDQAKCDQDCGNNALCIQGECQCLSGYVPSSDGHCTSACPNACSSNGRCIVSGSSSRGVCDCNDGFTGSDCGIVSVTDLGGGPDNGGLRHTMNTLLLILLCITFAVKNL